MRARFAAIWAAFSASLPPAAAPGLAAPPGDASAASATSAATSAVRPVDYQERLRETNGNATAAEGEVVSPHVTGATIDIAKQGLSRQEMGWMRSRLLAMEKAGKIDVEEEFRQACFHITVYKAYAGPEIDLDSPLEMPSPQAGETADQGR